MSKSSAPAPIKIMLDSGAFSAWTRGETIDLGRYIDFVKRYKSRLDTYVNLDVIPGSRGVQPTIREVDRAAAASFDNYKAMRSAGLSPIPVFHYGESFGWLVKLLESGADYICLGGTVGLKSGVKRKFLDECFTVITDGRGAPAVRVHGLGVTEGPLVARYPWHSVDSTSWLMAPTYGMILVPGIEDGKFSAQIYLADGHLQADKDGRRFERLPESAQQHVLEFATSCGCTITDLRNDVYSRMVLFVTCMMQMRAPARFERPRASFHLPRVAHPARGPKIDFHVVFAGAIRTAHQAIFRRCGVEHHLTSYYEYLKNPDKFGAYLDFLNSATRYDPNNREVARTDWKSMNYHDHRRRKLVARFSAPDEEVPF